MKFLQLTATLFLFSFRGLVETGECPSPQYIEGGLAGVIQCSFREDVFNVFWYNSSDFLRYDAIVTLKESVKGGGGFFSGEFDIHPNGSLIINNVSRIHEGTYIVIKLDTPTSKTTTHTVSVYVIAQTFDRLPVIEQCEQEIEICYLVVHPDSEVSCTVRDAISMVTLKWMVRTSDGDRNISSRSLTAKENNGYFTSRVLTLNPFVNSTVLQLLVCKGDDPLGLLKRNESLILLQSPETLINDQTEDIVAEIDSTVNLQGSYNKRSYLVWQVKHSPEVVFKTLLYAVFAEENFTHIIEEDYKLQQTSLVIDEIKVHNGGVYRSISGNGLDDEVVVYNLIVVVYPNPAYLEVDGCDLQQYCVLEVQSQGSLTCTLKQIHPLVNLDIVQVFEQSFYELNFYDRSLTAKENGDTFDVMLRVKYRYYGTAGSRVPVKCTVVDTNVDVLKLSTKFDLLYTQGDSSIGTAPFTDNTLSSNESSYLFIAVVLAVSVLGVLAIAGFVILKVRCRRKTKRSRKNIEHSTIHGETDKATSTTNGQKGYGKSQFIVNPEEVIPMMSKNHLQGKKAIFISQLRIKYQDLYDAVQPIPYIRDRMYCVDRVFVEGGIEYLVAKDKIGGQGTWEKFTSYHNILDDDRVKSKRRIIEGEPGYGKSTLTLQLSYDWCNKIAVSYLQGIDILIILRLRQLGGVTSIYRAIKQFLLPNDSNLTENDIANIIRECSSMLVILDGYDEYPDQDSDVDSDVISIIMRKMFQQFEVILTTRSSYLPRNIPAITKRLKLTGFDDDARNQYIRKAVACDDVAAAEKIKRRLKENPVLGDLCQVPLFFVMFAHMSHESKQFQKFNSVTSFFRYMISCFHSHIKNKMKDDNVPKYDLFETEHGELDNLAFEGLSRKDQQIVWNKQNMCERLGQDFYDQYVAIGILVEEEVLDISEDSNAIITEHIQYKTEVRFYHKLFCEWYAAHHLSEYASRDDVTFDPWEESESEISDSEENFLNTDQEKDIDYGSHIESQADHYLKYLDPFDLQYVYRFACGLNRVAAGKIIENLKTRRGGEKFTILCILEKSGKVEDVLEDVEDLCSRRVVINEGDSLLLQRSTIQLLEIAIAHEISISCVLLYNCYSTVDLRGGNHLQLKSNLSIPVLTTLNKLVIYTEDEGREITSEEFTGILQYSSKCLALKELRFWGCLLPPSVQAESVSVLRSRNVKVTWCPNYTDYQLNLQSSRWEFAPGLGTGVLSDEEYQTEFAPGLGTGVLSDEEYQTEVRRSREKWNLKQMTLLP